MLARLMRLSLVALALALTAVSLPTATAASNVIELNVDNFDSVGRGHGCAVASMVC